MFWCLLNFFAYFVVDPPRDFFTIPFLRHPVTWYGVFFALGFILAFYIFRSILAKYIENSLKKGEVKRVAALLTDKLTLYCILGTVIGARLGHVFFYDWPYYRAHPEAIVKVWEGGLASHGGTVGVLAALILFWVSYRKKYAYLRPLVLLEMFTIPAGLTASCIRMGNFINQEILGTPTTLPWGVIFLHPVEAVGQIPLHPVQLYEAVAYLLIFALLFTLWKRKVAILGSGLYAGLFFILVFGFRFFIEYFKAAQTPFDKASAVTMGQVLSLPFILLGGVFLGYYYAKRR